MLHNVSKPVGPNKPKHVDPVTKYNPAFKANLNKHIHKICIDLESRDSFFTKHIQLKNIIAQLTSADVRGNEDYRKDLMHLLDELYKNNTQLKSPLRANAKQIGQQEVAELNHFIACTDAEIMSFLKQEESKGNGFKLARPLDLKQQKAQFVTSNEPTSKLIYFSYPPDKLVNLNCAVLDDQQNKITCRQMSFAYLVEENILAKERTKAIQQPKRQGLVRSGDDLKQKNGYLHEAVFNALRKNKYDTNFCYLHADKLITFPLHKFSLALAEVIKDNLKQTVYMTLHSQNHAMAIILKPAKSAGYFTLKFFEPNKTNTHIRSLFKASNEIKEVYTNLKELKLTNYLSIEALHCFFPAIKSADKGALFANLNIFLDPNYGNMDPEFALEGPLEYQSLFDNLINTVKEELYCICCRTNNPSATGLQQKLDQLLNSDKSEKDKLNTLLFSPTYDDISGIAINYNHGHQHTARVYTAAILASTLSDAAKILAIKGSIKGAHGLGNAFTKEHTALIKNTLGQILNSNLAIKDKLSFLYTEESYPLFRKIKGFQTFEIYLQSILESTNTEEDKLALLNLQGATGNTVSSITSTAIAINCYLTIIINSSLSNPSKASMLSRAGTELLQRQPVPAQLSELLFSYAQIIADANLSIELKQQIFSQNKHGLSSLSQPAKQYIEQINQQFETRRTNAFLESIRLYGDKASK